MVVVVEGHDGGDESQVLRAGSAASVGCAGDCESYYWPSSSSCESNFRELDDVFLQTQARIWLGEVLQTRSDEQLPIADLIADGELLFEASRVIWKMLSTKHMELRYVKAHKYERFASRRSSGSRYLPYSNVDSFLKICKILGMAGIDLFSPSDVVEKRDTRKVCMCIRSLSKKARALHLNVPDFDIVTYTVAMSTNLVGNIRRNLELSHHTFSSTASNTPHHKPRQRSRQKHSNETSEGNGDSYFEESTEVESVFMLESGSSSSSCSNDISSQMNSLSLNSPGAPFSVKGYTSGQCSLELEDQNQQKDECSKRQWKEDHLNESTRSTCSHHLENDHHLDGALSTSAVKSTMYLCSTSSHSENGAKHSCENSRMDLIHVDHSLEDNASVVGDSGDCSTPRGNHNDDVEVSSTASMSSVSGPVRKLNFEDQIDEEGDFKTVWFHESSNSMATFLIEKSIERSESQDKVIYNTPVGCLITDCDEESPFDMKVMDIGFSSKLSVPCSNIQFENSDHAFLHKSGNCMSQVNTDLGYGEDRELFAVWSSLSDEFHQWDQNGKRKFAEVPTRASSLSLSQVDSPEEILPSVRSKPAGDALWPENTSINGITGDNDAEGHNATMYESDLENGKLPNKSLQTSCFNSMENKTDRESDSPDRIAAMVESKNPHGFKSSEDSSGFQQLCDSSVFQSHGAQIPDERRCSTTEHHQVSINEKKDMICCAENMDQVDDQNHEKVQAIENSNLTEGISVEMADCKPPRTPLLKTVAKGTAVVGVLLFLLHFRKNDAEKTDQSVRQSNRLRKANGWNFSSLKSQKGSRTNWMYPAEKLRFGN
ncbi:TRANSGELIN [Salix viminalis]|uniref:TRANSGELIN n=1 Tax=Salix viminalis TaxID=40686 RepID=A0A9Q0TBL8_SALVM|nr:TRANSGELIN [Salix viminalis]